jgi:hypothetical protein
MNIYKQVMPGELSMPYPGAVTYVEVAVFESSHFHEVTSCRVNYYSLEKGKHESRRRRADMTMHTLLHAYSKFSSSSFLSLFVLFSPIIWSFLSL